MGTLTKEEKRHLLQLLRQDALSNALLAYQCAPRYPGQAEKARQDGERAMALAAKIEATM
jgi:hypothetical protein